MSGGDHPTPAAGGDAGEHWSWLRRGELRLQRCSACGGFRHPPQPVCSTCGSTAREWVRAAGTGEVWTHTTIHPPVLPAFTERTPYRALVVRLDEGVFLVTNPVDGSGPFEIGDRVEVVPVRIHDELTLPLVRPT